MKSRILLTLVGLLAGGIYLWLRDRRQGETNRADARGGDWATIGPAGALWSGTW